MDSKVKFSRLWCVTNRRIGVVHDGANGELKRVIRGKRI
jgi:hypothetical protein